MKFPLMNSKGKGRINIPELTGGINLRDSLTQCNDNQLTELVNMWYKKGFLRTRPSGIFADKLTLSNADFAEETPFLDGWNIVFKTHTIFDEYMLGKRQLCSAKGYRYNTKNKLCENEFYFFWCDNKGNITELPKKNITSSIELTYFVIEKGNFLYLFTSNQKIYQLDMQNAKKWIEVPEIEYYVPTVYYHCLVEKGGNFSGTQLEGYNLIGNKFKMIYSTVNKNLESIDNSKRHDMEYSFPELKIGNLQLYDGKEVEAIITDELGKRTTHIATLRYDSVTKQLCGEENNLQSDNLRMIATIRGIYFLHSKSGEADQEHYITIDDTYIEDNLEITIPYIPTEEERAKVFNMTNCEWFGGASEGLAGGTRLFLSGNKNEKEKALVCWSGLNKPLYFPENSYFYVGDTTECVTGFGKQSEMLVIFKEHETWYTQYRQNTNITAENLINQSVLDMSSNVTYFPLTQINPNIGCPYPNTIQLCRNRLVWLGNNGNVYTLVSENQYNERSIFCVSEMVKSKLSKEDSAKISSCDFDGYYVLYCGGHMYLMDYNCYGYSHITGYSKTEDANIRIPWYYWELDINDSVVLCIEANLLILKYIQKSRFENDEIESYVLREDNIFCDGDKPIKSIAQTKLFDFGEPNYFKNINSVGLSLGYNDGEEITVTFISDCGEDSTAILLEDEATERTADFTKSVLLSPGICSSSRFGLRLECEGNMLIDGINMDYRIKGRVR